MDTLPIIHTNSIPNLGMPILGNQSSQKQAKFWFYKIIMIWLYFFNFIHLKTMRIC